jgi:hypothetical protein
VPRFAAHLDLAGGITASSKLIGSKYRNRWWENVVMGWLVALAVYFAVQATITLVGQMGRLLG